MKYKELTSDLVEELNNAVRNNNGEEFFETLGFTVYDCGDGWWELSDIHTKGGVEMPFIIRKAAWYLSIDEYYNDFNIDEEIHIHREDPSYCSAFTYQQSVDDFRDWRYYISALAIIANSDGEFHDYESLINNRHKFVLVFPKIKKFDIEEVLDKLDDKGLIDLYVKYPDEVMKLTIDEFVDKYSWGDRDVVDKYIRFIA